jgi:hypothetical protein
MSVKYKLRESVVSYLTDPGLAAAVEAVLAAGTKIPVDLKTEDLPLFYEALWSARQIQCEYALDLDSLWKIVWHEPAARAGLSIDEPGESRSLEDGNLHPEAVWENDELVRYAEDGRYSFWVSLTSQGVSGGCYLDEGLTLAGLTRSGDYYSSPEIPIDAEGELDLASLVAISSLLPETLKSHLAAIGARSALRPNRVGVRTRRS